MSLEDSGNWYSGVSGEHSGSPRTSFLEIPTEPEAGPIPGIQDFALFVLSIYNESNKANKATLGDFADTLNNLADDVREEKGFNTIFLINLSP